MLRITGIANKLVGSAEEAKAAGLDVADVDYPGGDGKVAVPYGDKVKLLYKITITGDPGKEFMVTDDGATHVGGPELNADLTMPKGGSVVIYATRVFSVANIDANGKLSNTATVTPGKGIESSSSSTETTPAWEAVLDSELPKTGGDGTGAYVIAGVALIAIAGVGAIWYTARRRRDGGGDPHGRDA